MKYVLDSSVAFKWEFGCSPSKASHGGVLSLETGSKSLPAYLEHGLANIG